MSLIKIVGKWILVLICTGFINSSNGELFKINKLNLVWTKAQHSLGPTKLKDLKNDLDKQEVDELTLKKMKAHNQDKDGLFEAAIRKRLLSIMTKYSLDRYFNDISPASLADNLSSEPAPSLKTTFRDKKLDKLWKKAEKLGFTQEQLMTLQEEFQHHQDKLDEHYETMNELEEKLEHESAKTIDNPNSIESTQVEETSRRSISKETQSAKKARLDTNVQQMLKDKYKSIKKNIDELHQKILAEQVERTKDEPFDEAPVNELWAAAIQSNFSMPDLESFREELKHFETRIKKLKHFQVQLERDQLISSDDPTEDNSETKHLKKKVKELNYKVNKIKKSLEKRVTEYRDEL